MTDVIESVGPALGVLAFVGLAVLAFLIFQQAREVRRLREWAGRAPERAAEAADASLAAAEARGETVAEEEREPVRGRFGHAWDAFRGWIEPRYAAIDRRMPLDPRYVVAALGAGLIAAGVLTSGFGVFGDEAGGGGGGKRAVGGGGKQGRPEVTVLNATQVEAADGTEIQGVPMLAAKVADQVVRPAGYRIARTDDAASGVERTVVMYEPGVEDEATKLAERVSDQLGPTDVQPMVSAAADRAGGAPLVLLIGLDNEDF